MSADLYFTSVSSFFLSFFLLFFAAWSPRSLNGTERKSATWSEVSVIYTCMSEIWNAPSPCKSEPQKHLFGRLRNLTANLRAYIFGMKHDIDNRSSAWQPQGVSYIVPKCHELWSTNSFKRDLHFYPLYVNSAFHFIARLRRRRSANGTQPHFVKRSTAVSYTHLTLPTILRV